MKALASLALLLVCLVAWSRYRPRERRIRGRELLSDWKAKRIGKRVEGQEDGRIVWGGKRIPRRNETMHFLVVGTTGAGKTTIIRNLMETVLPAMSEEPDQRALVYDAKGDMLPFLRRIGCSTVSLNPLDVNGSSWAMGRDVRDALTAYEIASIFIPEEESQNRFFSDAARDILCEIMKTLMATAGEAWTLRDVICACKNRHWLWSVLSSTPDGRDIYEDYFAEERTGASVRMTLRSRLAPLEPIAAMWSTARSTVSIDEWSCGSFALVLGDSERGKTVLHALNRIIFKRAVEVVLDQSESTARRTWFIVDEGKEAKKLDGFPGLLAKARSRGGAIVLGIQGVEGWRAVWGAEEANEMLGMFSHKALLRFESHDTAAWASKSIGEVDSIEIRTSVSSDGSWKRSSRSASEHRVRTDAVLASEFQSIPPTNMNNGLTGYYTAADIGAYRNVTSLKNLLVRRGKPEAELEPLLQRSHDEQLLVRWGGEDFQRLGILERKCPVETGRLEADRQRRSQALRREVGRG